MLKGKSIYTPYFNSTEKQLIYSALEEAGEYIRKFYCFSPREWFNHCYDIKTQSESKICNADKQAFAEVKKYTPILKNASSFPEDRYRILLFDYNILSALWERSNLDFYPFMIYILTHELIHIARFCQNSHPFESDEDSCQKEETKVTELTQRVLKIEKNKFISKIAHLYSTLHAADTPKPVVLLKEPG